MIKKNQITKNYSFIVVGGGMSGLCAAIASARGGVKTALIQNRPVLGGNASSEIRMHICGADNHGHRDNARETGILEEILLENKYRNNHYDYPIFDSILWEKAHFQDNLDLYLNAHMTDVSATNHHIDSITVHQITTERLYKLNADYFADMTGDGSLSVLSGASYMSGREASSTFDEPHAPAQADDICMGSTLLFRTLDAGKAVPFIRPEWANIYTEEDLAHREHGASGYNYWWIELGGDELDTISDSELIRDELLKAVYGVWDHIKNGGDHGAENYSLDWMGFLPGKRESRRIVGDYVLTENDLANTHHFNDAVAYGGWPMDMHVPGGLSAKLEPTEFIHVPDVYEIPYRSLYAKDMDNLLIGGRIISASHMAFGSTRVMATCAVIGQAVGTSVRFLIDSPLRPKDLADNPEVLQQSLLREDAYIPNVINKDPLDIARNLSISASSTLEGTRASAIIDGYPRDIKDECHHWSSISEKNAWLKLDNTTPFEVKTVELKFDSNLSTQIMLSMFDNGLKDKTNGVPSTLVKDYTIEFLLNNQVIQTLVISNNHYRFRSHTLENSIQCDALKINFNSTHGSDVFRVFEVRLYKN